MDYEQLKKFDDARARLANLEYSVKGYLTQMETACTEIGAYLPEDVKEERDKFLESLSKYNGTLQRLVRERMDAE